MTKPDFEVKTNDEIILRCADDNTALVCFQSQMTKAMESQLHGTNTVELLLYHEKKFIKFTREIGELA